ncbi:thymidylate synthase [Nanoarchaeota archaeon]
MEIEEKTTLRAWKEALKKTIDFGSDFIDVDKRKCRQALNLLVKIDNPEADIKKPVQLMNAFKKWEYPPMDELANIMLSKKVSSAYVYSYGSRLFNFSKEVDQIDKFVVPLLKKDPTSRRAFVVVWDPKIDANLVSKEVPGLVSIDFKIHEGKLHLTATIRSNDMFFGWPANIYQLFVLQKYVADKLDAGIGSLSTFSTSAHIFEEHFEDIREIIES